VAPVNGTTPFPRELTFDPRHPGTPKTVAVGPKRALLNGIACPSAHQCTTVAQGGQAITFNPSAPTHARTIRISSGGLQAITCPTRTQCTALDQDGGETTFDPRAGDHRSTFGLGSPDSSGISCPTVNQCTATVLGRRRLILMRPGATAGSTLRSSTAPRSTVRTQGHAW
jgi:hypothetical protein